MTPEPTYVPRPEFELMCRAVNGSLVRIEAGLKDVNTKLDVLTEADNQRVTWEAHDRHKEECAKKMEKLQGRPSWAVALVITTLSGGLVTTLTLILTGVIK
jgi:hypothetical protein